MAAQEPAARAAAAGPDDRSSRVLGFRLASPSAWSRRPVHARLTGRECCAARARTRLMAGSAGSVETLSLKKTRMPTVPLVEAQSAIVSATAGSVGSTGLTSLNRLGCAL